jgi:hypothetical protein
MSVLAIYLIMIISAWLAPTQHLYVVQAMNLSEFFGILSELRLSQLELGDVVVVSLSGGAFSA